MKSKLVIGSRGSQLALVQAESVAELLRSANPGLEVSIVKIATAGDKDRSTHLDRIGVAVFVKELEEATGDGRVDIAVHSLKDVPTEPAPGMRLLATPPRADPRDVLVARHKLSELPPGACIGTDSLRRSVQIRHIRSDLRVVGIRGNVDTRLRKVQKGEIEGVITAAAALARLGWSDRIADFLPFVPAVGQGALAIEGRMGDNETAGLVEKVNHLPTWQSVMAERAFLHALGGGCRAPIAALGTVENGRLKLDGLVAGVRSGDVLREIEEDKATEAEAIGKRLAERLLAKGAARLIQEAKGK